MAYNHPKSFYKAVTVIVMGFFLLAFRAPSYFNAPAETAEFVKLKEPVIVHNKEDVFIGGGRRLLQDGLTCQDVGSQYNATLKCELAQRECSNDGFFGYFDFVYCDLGDLVPLAMTVLVLWWLFLFIGLAVCADDFFCPSLVVISKTLRLSPNVAGVTFLAFGNGAPDFFSAITALSSADGDGELGIGGLFGAGMFVTSCVVGAIAVVKPFQAMARPFLRDIIFYIVAVYWAFLMLWREKVYLVETICYVCLYVIYVVVVVVSGKIYQSQKNKAENGGGGDKGQNGPGGVTLTRLTSSVEATGFHSEGLDRAMNISFSFDLTEDTEGKDNPAFDNEEVEEHTKRNAKREHERKSSMELTEEQRERLSSRGSSIANGDGGKKVFFTTESTMDLVPDRAAEKEAEANVEEEVEYLPVWKIFLYGINPINVEEWPDMPIYSKIYEIFKSPLMFCIQLTCPVVNYDDEELNNWNRPLNCLQCFISPTVGVFLVQVALTKLGGVFPVYGITLVVGAVLAAVVFFTSKTYEKPKYHEAFGYLGFLVALVWIYTLATEIVSLLETFGVVFGISEAILGLTLLAWGNSIGDLIANTVMARQGFARMGFAACYGAPFFNLTLGFGLAMTIKIVSSGASEAQLVFTPIQLILALFLALSLLSSIIAIPLILSFHVRRVYGIYLLLLYIVFLVVALLTETGVILDGFTN